MVSCPWTILMPVTLSQRITTSEVSNDETSESPGAALAKRKHHRRTSLTMGVQEGKAVCKSTAAACKNKAVKARKPKSKWKYRNSADNTHHHIGPSGIIWKQSVDADHPIWLKRGSDVHHGHCGCYPVEERSPQTLGRGRACSAAGPAACCPTCWVYRPHLQHAKRKNRETVSEGLKPTKHPRLAKDATAAVPTLTKKQSNDTHVKRSLTATQCLWWLSDVLTAEWNIPHCYIQVKEDFLTQAVCVCVRPS